MCAVAALPAAAEGAARGPVTRAFAVQPKLDLAWMESRRTYRAKMLALADRTARGPGAPPIQEGADDVASHLLGPSDRARPAATARDLVAFPEDIGLFAALTGERARPARGAGSLEGAIAALLATYAPQLSFYAERHPELAGRAPQTRLLALALTDTFARVAVETFAELADRHDVYLHAGVNMAQAWRVVCRDRGAFNAARPPRLPGGVLCEEEDGERVRRLGDPGEPGRDYAYEATTAKASNLALVFDPDGRLISRQVKTYIPPVELPGQLDLVPGEVSDGLGAVETPVGTLGFVTSKDAWMPDVQAKLDQRHVNVLVQPEFFVGELLRREGMWAPDTLKASGYNDVLRLPSVEALVLPELVGNVFSFSADAQAHIAVKPRRGNVGTGLAGQPAAAGLIGVTPYVVPDPVRPDEPFDERRRRLAAAGEALAPGSGVRCADPARPAPCENGHVETVLFRDVALGARPYRRFRGRRARTRFSRSRPVAPSRLPQRGAAVAMRGRRAVLAYEERRQGRDQVLLVRSRDGGRTWSRPVRPTGRPPGSTDEWWPAVALGDRGRVTVAWVDRSSGRERVYHSRSVNGGRRFRPPRPLDDAAAPAVAQWRPALAQGRGDVVHAAFIDERDRFAGEDLPQAGLFYTRIEAGGAEPARRLDATGRAAPLAQSLDHAWAPGVAARGERVLVTWLDFQNYDWDAFARLSEDRGASFGPQGAVNDTREDDPATAVNEQDEALNDSPRAALGVGAPLVAWTDWRKRASSATRPHQAYDTFLRRLDEPDNRQVDPYGDAQVSTFAPAVCADGRNDALVAFQDSSGGQSDIRTVSVADGRRPGPARRVDDTGARGGNAWRPALGCFGRRVLVAWEDERDGPGQIYAATAARDRLR